MIAILKKEMFNDRIREVLSFVPAAIFPAIIFPAIFLDNNGFLHGVPFSGRQHSKPPERGPRVTAGCKPVANAGGPDYLSLSLIIAGIVIWKYSKRPFWARRLHL